MKISLAMIASLWTLPNTRFVALIAHSTLFHCRLEKLVVAGMKKEEIGAVEWHRCTACNMEIGMCDTYIDHTYRYAKKYDFFAKMSITNYLWSSQTISNRHLKKNRFFFCNDMCLLSYRHPWNIHPHMEIIKKMCSTCIRFYTTIGMTSHCTTPYVTRHKKKDVTLRV